MTLVQATQRLLDAAAAEDFKALEEALVARAEAIAVASPSELAASFEAGEKVCLALRSLKLRLGVESARLARIQWGFAMGGRRRPNIDCRG